MWPRNDARQAVLDARVEVWPPARTYRYEDYWGTVVTAFDVHAQARGADRDRHVARSRRCRPVT